MMRAMKGEEGSNPEMQELNGVLDKLMAVQHPRQMKDSMARTLENSSPVEVEAGKPPISFLSRESTAIVEPAAGFFGLVGDLGATPSPTAINAFVPETQTLTSGSTVRLQLTGGVTINDVNIPAGTNIYGLASLNNERLLVNIKSLQMGGQLFSVNLQVYDEDGQEGIFMPGAITREMAKQSADQSINSLGLSSFDPSLGAQAGTAGIQLAKNLLSRKVKMVRVTVKAGYKVWLKDSSKNKK